MNATAQGQGPEPGFFGAPSSVPRGTAPTSGENNGLMDVDMLDVADLEKERGDVPAGANQGQVTAEEQEELNRARLQRQALTFEQKCLIEKLMEEKMSVFTYSIKNQFNNLHLELIKNFQRQESEVRGALMHVAFQNKQKKLQLERLKAENQELRRIQF